LTEKNELLLEIGCEEIPTSFIMPALEKLEKEFRAFCEQNRIGHGEVSVYATPRRLTLIAKDVADSQEEKVTEVKGPPAKAAVDAEGKFTPAASKFAESRGGSLKQLSVRRTDKGEYVFLTMREKGGKTAKALPELPGWIIGKLSFPKSMRWDVRRVTFARPVRWILLLFGNKPVPVKYEGIPSGGFTHGNRYFGDKRIKVSSSAEYFEKLEAAGVIADHRRRREMIRESVLKLAGGKPHITETLLNDVTFLVEYPYLAVGSFPEEYTKLPNEVQIICIEKNQHYFPVEDPAAGKMLPRFIVVMNVPLTDSKTVITGYEKVLNSRLKDAVFFYDEDLKKPLAERVESLSRITFQEKLGSLLDKTKRVQELAKTIGKAVNMDAADVETAERAAWLMKADLTTQMVFEYTEIQGTVGKYYALKGGENAAVAQAIEDHYMPRFAEDELPKTAPGALLAVADKMDTIVGYFAVGLIPSGSADPYQLRRAALGVIRILDNMKFNLETSRLISETICNYKNSIPGLIGDEGEIRNSVLRFFEERHGNYLKSEGLSYDVINAVIGGGKGKTIIQIRRIVEALTEVRDSAEFQDMLEVYTRISNIIQKTTRTQTGIRQELFEGPEEKSLNEKTGELHKALEEMNVKGASYKDQIGRLYELSPIINCFFDKVMVNAENPEVRENRINLLHEVKDLYLNRIADLKQIVKKG